MGVEGARVCRNGEEREAQGVQVWGREGSGQSVPECGIDSVGEDRPGRPGKGMGSVGRRMNHGASRMGSRCVGRWWERVSRNGERSVLEGT
jgi:hypothetical protein